MQEIERYIDENRSRFEEELFEFLRIPSVSADSKFKTEVRAAGEFVAEQFRSLGLNTQVIETNRHPLVYAEWLAAENAPTLLLYGHYDVQPPDPLKLWESPPFEPTVRNGSVYARGATDDKGQMFTHIKAVQAWLATKQKLPINVKFLIEGEEEVGSESIEAYLAEHAEQLACDYVVISDCSMLGPDKPAITCSLKGLCYFEVFLKGPKRDLHSGSFGGSVKNPANAICELMASLVDADGRVQLPGFYDDVVDLTAEERKQIAAVSESEEYYAEEMGVSELFGEKGYTTLERRWARPTCDVNGIFGGYQGEGAKTVIPAEAGAKVSFRLVANQDPDKIAQAFKAHMEKHCPPGIQMEIVSHHGGKPVSVPLGSPGLNAAAQALQKSFGTEPYYIREGGSIPIVSSFKQHLGADSLLLGFGLPDDNTHSPNEKFNLNDFYRGTRAMAFLFDEISKISRDGNGG